MELCRIEADHLHNIPTLLHEDNEHRHEYYIRGERGLFLQRLRQLGATEYLEQVRSGTRSPGRFWLQRQVISFRHGMTRPDQAVKQTSAARSISVARRS